MENWYGELKDYDTPVAESKEINMTGTLGLTVRVLIVADGKFSVSCGENCFAFGILTRYADGEGNQSVDNSKKTAEMLMSSDCEEYTLIELGYGEVLFTGKTGPNIKKWWGKLTDITPKQ